MKLFLDVGKTFKKIETQSEWEKKGDIKAINVDFPQGEGQTTFTLYFRSVDSSLAPHKMRHTWSI